jgi:hypothetical protein
MEIDSIFKNNCYDIDKKYQGKFVALSYGHNKKVIASGESYAEVVKYAEKIAKGKNNFGIIFIPQKDE